MCGHRVLLSPETIKDTTEWGFQFAGEEWKREKAATQIGVIVDIGKNAWLAFDNGDPWAEVGDRVYFAKYAGKFIELDGEEYVIVNDEDIQCIIHEEESYD